jgi:hypothetical protein
MNLSDQIRASLDQPGELERLYRSQPEAFQAEISSILTEHPDNLVLQVWQERLYFQATPSQGHKTEIDWLEILFVGGLCLLAGTIAKLPAWIPALEDEFFYARNLNFALFPALAAYFLYRNRPGKRITSATVALLLLPLVYINVLPEINSSQTIALACLHLPFFLWAVLGLSFTGKGFNTSTARMAYLKYNGECLIYSAIVLLCILVLIAISLGLFEAISVDVSRLYGEYILVYGLLAAPIVATHLTQVYGRVAGNLAPILARIFCPLVLLTLLIYLVTIVAIGQNPFADREFLLIFNVMLLAVLAIVIFTVSERPEDLQRRLIDYITVALVGVALVVDSVALAAISFRLVSYGITPNRMAVLGANVLIFVNLAGVLFQYVRFLQGRSPIIKLRTWITNYLPVYSAWTALVTFGFPLAFWLQ